MTRFTAKRDGADFILKADGIPFGRLADCEWTHVFIADDEQLDQYVEIEGGMSIREMLTAVRAGYELAEKEFRAESEAERLTETAWLRAAEYGPEAFAEMVNEDMAAR